MYDDPNSDPNERERAPFENQYGPPQYQQQPVQQPAQPQQGYPPQQVMNPPPQQPYQGNGHGQTYQPPRPAPRSSMAKRLHVLEMAAKTGAFQVAQLWAEQVAMFRQECQSQTGYVLGEREALDIITSLLYQAAD